MVDCFFQFGFFVFTIAQLLWLESQGVQHCSTQKSSYASETTWMKHTAYANLLSLIVHFIWRHYAKLDLKMPHAARRYSSSQSTTKSYQPDSLD